jgi:hypothetical protein
MDSIFEMKLDIDNYGIIVMNDFFRMLTIQLFSQFMYSYMNNTEFLSSSFMENTSYILLSIFFYWFVFNKIFYVKSTQENSEKTYDSNLPQYLRIR